MEDDETVPFKKMPISFQADVLNYHISTSAFVDEKEAFSYDSDAAERV